MTDLVNGAFVILIAAAAGYFGAVKAAEAQVGRPASRRTSFTVDVLALRHPSNATVVTVRPWRRKTPRRSG
jgi:hypothetical protein